MIKKILEYVFSTEQIESNIKDQERRLKAIKDDMAAIATIRDGIRYEVHELRAELTGLKARKELSTELEMYKLFVGGRHFNLKDNK